MARGKWTGFDKSQLGSGNGLTEEQIDFWKKLELGSGETPPHEEGRSHFGELVDLAPESLRERPGLRKGE